MTGLGVILVAGAGCRVLRFKEIPRAAFKPAPGLEEHDIEDMFDHADED